MLKALYVPAKGISQEKEFLDLDEIFATLKIQDEWETMLLQEIEGVGIIANDQDKEGLKQNRLGLKGDFVIIGMERLDPDSPQNPHSFHSLTDEQLSDLRISLSLQTYRDILQK